MRKKSRIFLGLLGLFILIICLSGVGLTKEYNFQKIAQIISSSNTQLSNPAYNLIDEDLSTFWQLKPQSEAGWVELDLGGKVLIHGLKVCGELANETQLTVEYRQDDEWAKFIAGDYRNLPREEVLDFSYDRVVTGRLRIRLAGTGAPYSTLSEVKVIGEDAKELLYRITPQAVEASAHTSYLTRAEFLTDGNTYTYWMVKPRYRSGNNWLFETLERYLGLEIDYNQNFNWPNYPSYYNRGEVLFDLGTMQSINNINIFYTEDSRGTLKVEAEENGSWREVGYLPRQDQPGWRRLAFAQPVLSAKFRLVMEESGHESVGGISEVEFWGTGHYPGDRHLELGPQTSQALTDPINRQFNLKKAEVTDDSRRHALQFVVAPESGARQTLDVELNGQSYSAVKTVTINGQNIYNLKLTAEMLSDDTNYLRINAQPGILTGLKLTCSAGGEQLSFGSPYADGLVLTGGAALYDPVFDLEQEVLVEEVTVYVNEATWLNLYYEKDGNWIALDGGISSPGCIRFRTPFTTRQIKIVNPSQININEVRVLGSAVSDHAPVIQLLCPSDYEVFDTNRLSDKHLIGFVDNPGARVTVNGKEPFQIGHYFGFHLTAVGINTWEDTIVEAVAVDPQGRVGRDSTHVIIDQLPWLSLDQLEKTAFVDNATYQLSGELQKPHCLVKINGQLITDRKGRFSTEVPLVEGLNLVRVECIYQKPGNNGGNNPKKDGFTQTFYRKVVRYSSPPTLDVQTPLSDSWIAGESVLVTGKAYGLGELKVWVNDQPALVEGEKFRLSAPLVEGENNLKIRLQDARGETAKATLTVWRDTIAPVISVAQPPNRWISNSALVAVSGNVTDAFPACITVNGKVASIDGNEFSAEIVLDEGWNLVAIKAWDTAGNGVEETIEVLVDTEPPFPFTINAEPDGWTSNTQPVLTFETTDITSGLTRYLLSIDGSAFTEVTSPYQLPPQLDGEHSITVKAVDQAGWETDSSVKVYIDTTAPVAVPGFKAVPGDDKVILSWEQGDEDIVKYVVNRSPAFKDSVALEIPAGEYTYIDSEVETLKSYTYSIHGVDRSGNLGAVKSTPTVKPGLAEVPASPSAETAVEYENIVVAVPQGALEEAKTITVTKLSQAEAEPILDKSYALSVSPVYCLSAKTPEGPVDPNGVEFEKPVLVGIKYQLEDEYSILKESNLRAYYYNYAANNWEVIPESYVDGENDTVYFFTKHFSMFSVQASVAPQMGPEQISNMGISPGQSYYQNNQVSISYGGGSASVTAKDFVLPGRGGLDLTISRTYDSGLAQTDWGIDEKNIFQAACGFIDFGNTYFNMIANLISAQIDRYLSEPAGSCNFGRGWRMNFVWVEKNENGQFLHMPGGGMKKIKWTMDGSGWSRQGHGVFECHAGEHFILEQTQEFVRNISSDSGVKTGENWRTTGYTLTTKDGTRYYMDGSGRLVRIVNRLGTSEINFYYDHKDRVDYIIDSVGRRIDFSYDKDNFITSISGAGKTVRYYYDDDLQELERVVDGGIHETRYRYTREKLHMGAKTVSLVSIVTNILSQNWVGLFVSLLPVERSDEVYYLDSVTTPFDGEYKITYTKYNAVRYGEVFAGYSIMGYEFCKATRLQELGSAYTKDVAIEYNLAYNNDEPPMVFTCDVIEGRSPDWPDGRKRTHMLFDRYSNSVDKDTSMLKMQTVYGEDGRAISVHLVDEFDKELAAPTRVIDQTGGRNTVQEFKYDNWGNVIWQKNFHTEVEAFYTYANTNAPPFGVEQAIADPYGNQTVANHIHDAKTGELILNYNGEQCIPQQTAYRYDPNGNLLEKAIRSQTSWPLRTGYEYDEFGNIVSMTSPSGVKTAYEYSTAYQQALLTKVTLSKLTDADQKVQENVVLKEMGYNPITYRKRWEKDARGYVTEYQYDTIGREVMTVLPDDNDDPAYRPTVLTGEIDRSGFRGDNPVRQVIFKDNARTTTIIDPLNNRTDYIYDSFEHLLEVVKFQKRAGGYSEYSRVKVGYDNNGNISEIISPDGNAHPELVEQYTTKYLYDEQNRLNKIEYPKTNKDEAFNPCKVYFYNDLTNEVKVLDENSNETIIKKDPVDRVVEEIAGSRSADQVSVQYTYDSLGNKTTETIDDTITTRFEYNDLNQLVCKVLPQEEVLNDPNGQTMEKSPVYRYEYDFEGNLVKEVSPLGTVITHVYDELNREIETYTEFTKLDGSKVTSSTKTYYDLAGNKIKVVDANGKATEMTYTAQGLLATQQDPMGGVTSFQYDKVGNKISETDPRGNAPEAAPNSYTAWYYYDELYRLVKGVLPDQTPPADPSNPGDNPVITFAYDRNGNCIKETKANGQEVNYKYNGRNWVDEQSQILDGQTYTTRYVYDGMGNQRHIYDNKGNKTEYRYDALNRLALEIYPEGNTVEYEYDNRGNKHIIRDGKHNATEYIYNHLNQLAQVIDAKGNTTTNWYNEEGQMTKTVTPTGLVTKFYPNELGLSLKIEDSLGQFRLFDFDVAGNTVYKKDPRGTETTLVYDDLYRVLRTDLRNGTKHQYLSYDYDQVGNIKQADNGEVKLIYNNADQNYESDPFNRVTKVTQVLPGGARYNTEYQYDLMGQLTGMRYPNSQEWLIYEYDLMGRLVAIPGFAGTMTTPGFTYDENSALRMAKSDNGITMEIPAIGGRDKNGRLREMLYTGTNGNEVLRLTYDYDKTNNIVRRNDNTYVYDELNRLQRATIYGAFEDKFTKDDLDIGQADQDYHGGKEPEVDVTDQTEIKLDYSARSLIFNLRTEAENISRIELVPVQIRHRVPVEQIEIFFKQSETDPFFTKLDRSAWTGNKDAQGRLTIKFKTVLEARLLKVHCNYDDLDLWQLPVDRAEFFNTPEKLITVYQKLLARTEGYEYDALGNRTTERILLRKEYEWSYGYYPNSNRLQFKAKAGGTERVDYEYDPNGNLTVKVVTKEETVIRWEYAYDLLNQLKAVKKDGEVVSAYTYDPNGFRVEKVGSTGKIHYVPHLNGEVCYRKEFSSNLEYSFIYVGGQHFARVDGVIGGNGQKYYYHNDHLGSALAVTDGNGNKVVERDFTPFGERINVDMYDETNRDLVEDDSGFTGKDWDADVELYYFNARWYDADIGRFISEDSINDPNNFNEYIYAADNPINNIDPTGHFNVSLARGTSLISASLNALSAIDPWAGKALSCFNTLLNTCSAFKYVENFYLTHIVRNYTKTSSWNSKTDIPGVSYSETSTETFLEGKSQSNTLTQKFDNKDKKASIEITTTTTADGKTTQKYTITKPDGTTKTRDITYGEDGLADIIGMEGFTSDPTFGALMIATTQKHGAVFASAGSTKPNIDPKTGKPTGAEIVDTDTFGRAYEMTYGTHNGKPALVLEGGGKIRTTVKNPNPGTKNDPNPNYDTMYASEIMIHYGYHNAWRGSLGCQTIRPGSAIPYDRKGFAEYTNYSNFMDSVLSNMKRTDGVFIGYYYLERL